MIGLLETLITFIGLMLVLALAAERLQELVKAGLAIKGSTRLAAVRQLIVEASRKQGLLQSGGQEIYEQVIERLRNLGQSGVRKKAVRLDAIDKCQLSGLIAAVEHSRISGMGGDGAPGAEKKLKEIAQQAEEWFELAMEPVADRYRRRMQGWSLAAAAVIVGLLNADAVELLRRARTDPALRQVVAAEVPRLNAADSLAKRLSDSVRVAERDTTKPAATLAAIKARRDTAVARRDSILKVVTAGSASLFSGYPRDFRPSWTWAVGMLASILLVSLGAPFWHDMLESVLGLKSKLQQQSGTAKQAGGRARAPARLTTTTADESEEQEPEEAAAPAGKKPRSRKKKEVEAPTP